ncbi:class I SAM-dependent methyltransferase [Flagellimonas myxillae]|uniref:class I SAM-dependent methyltransferase n=1 Tax=Flagellimonas myxillae TaxID=2942214 RepID=UPI0029E7D141|nr:class I SAM-dependent methyltransferase [Muricauda myxillae]
MSVLLKKPLFEGISQKELVAQLETKKKCHKKLPSWFNTPNIYYPNKLNIEQTSSERTAAYKAGLMHGKRLLDLTGGLGVDCYYFAKKMETVFHCEMDSNLSEIANHNFQVLGQNNIHCIAGNGLEILVSIHEKFDWVFVDPSRRDDVKGRVFLLKDCLPNIPEALSMIFQKTSKVLIKTSPLLDITQGIAELKFVKEIHVVAVQNEVKELLYFLEHGYSGEVQIKTVNLLQDREVAFNFTFSDEQQTAVQFGKPEAYLYEPNAAVLKSGGFKSVAASFGLKKLHQHSHLYTTDKQIDFPGRAFKIERVLPYSKKELKSLSLKKANITTRNFPLTVAALRKTHKIKDGGDSYLFFTRTENDQLIVLDCTKLS